tara:strand:- start:8613 stop:8924 length:312 start_codon:yes stop_codon:yes gene_type:complete
LKYAQEGWAIDSGQYQKNTGGLPKWYTDRPTPRRGEDFFIGAFWELSTTRTFGQVIGPIPWNRIVEYGYHKGLEPDMIGVLELVVRELDECWLEQQRNAQGTG